MAVYRRYIIQQKYVDGKPTEEYRLGLEKESTNYHSLEECESGSECTDIEYQWVAVSGDYYCIGNAKYQKLKKQQKCANATEWADVYPYEYKQGDVIEKESKDCGASEKYTVTLLNDTHCALSIVPSQSYYLSTDSAVINFASISDSYLWNGMYYGSSTDNWQFANQSVFNISQFSQNWYFSGVTSASISTSGSLYYKYSDGTESWYNNSLSVLDIAYYKGKSATVIIDYGNTVNVLYSFQFHSYLTSISFPVCTSVNASAFAYCYSLLSVSLPVCEYIGPYAFENCHSLTGINLPNCPRISYSAFDACYRMSYALLPICKTIDSFAFYRCSKLPSIDLPVCTYIDNGAFAYCSNLSSVSLPVCTYINYNAFAYCSNLSSVSLPVCSFLGGTTFIECSNLSSVSLPVCEYMSMRTFKLCTTLSIVSLPVCSFIGMETFSGCYSLSDVYLNYSGVVVFGSVNASVSSKSYISGLFTSCHSSLRIHIPESLCDAYNSAYGSYRVILYSGVTKYYSELFSCDIRPTAPTYYYLICGDSNVRVTPSKASYSSGDVVDISWIGNSVMYSFLYFQYGSTAAYGQTTTSTNFSLTMSQDWYVGVSYKQNISSGSLLYISYVNGKESYYPYNSNYFSYGTKTNDMTDITVIYDNTKNIKNYYIPFDATSSAIFYFPNASVLGTFVGGVTVSSANPSFYLLNCSALSYATAGRLGIFVGYLYAPNLKYLSSNIIASSMYCPNLEVMEAFVGSYKSVLSFSNLYGIIGFQSLTASGKVGGYTDGLTNLTLITEINLPVCEFIGTLESTQCVSIDLPKCYHLGGLMSNSLLESVSLPVATYCGSIWDSPNLTSLYLPVCEHFGGLYNSINSTFVYLGLNSVVSIDTFYGYNVKYVVPNSLYNAYITKYSSYSSRFLSSNMQTYSPIIPTYHIDSIYFRVSMSHFYGSVTITPSKSMYNLSDTITISIPNEWSSYFQSGRTGVFSVYSFHKKTLSYDFIKYTSYYYTMSDGSVSEVSTYTGYLSAYARSMTELNDKNGALYVITLQGYTSSNKYYTFSYLESLYLPICKWLSLDVVSTFKSLYAPNCKTFYGHGYSPNTGLTSIDLPNCENFTLFSGNFKNLTSISLPMCTSFYISAIAPNLTSISLPMCTFIGGMLSTAVSAIYSNDIVSYIDVAAFSDCASLEELYLPKCRTIGEDAFKYCYSLKIVSLPYCLSIDSYAFQYCSMLTDVYLGLGFVVNFGERSTTDMYRHYYSDIFPSTTKIHIVSSVYSYYVEEYPLISSQFISDL